MTAVCICTMDVTLIWQESNLIMHMVDIHPYNGHSAGEEKVTGCILQRRLWDENVILSWRFFFKWTIHDDVIEWKHFLRYRPFVWEIHRSPVHFPHEGQWRGILMFSLICAWISSLVNNHEAGDLRRHRAFYDITVMNCECCVQLCISHENRAVVSWTKLCLNKIIAQFRGIRIMS